VSLPAIVNAPHQQPFTRIPGDVSIVRDILTPQDRPVRLPLAQWAAKKLDEFSRLRQEPAYDRTEVCGPIVDCFNETALIETYYGRLDRAEAVCYAAMKWVDGLVAATGSAFCYRFAFQPYVNLGRLDRIEKRWQDSLDKFQVVEEALRGNPVRFGPIAIDGKSLAAMTEKFPDPAVLQNIFILDTLKTFLKASWHEKALAFCPPWMDPSRKIQDDFMCEASLVALECMGKPAQALELNNEFLRGNPGNRNRLVFLYRRIEILLAMNANEEAARLARKLAAVFSEYGGTLSHHKLIVLARICDVMLSLELPEAGPLLWSGWNAAAKLGDVFLQREFLQMLARSLPPGEARDKVHCSLDEFSATVLYGAAHKPGRAGTENIRALSEQLLAFAGQI
jgi:tetratricopeptide (TPR) repeat protein